MRLMFGSHPVRGRAGGAEGRASESDRMLVGFAVTGCGGEIHMDLDEAVLYRLAFALADQLREADSRIRPGRRSSARRSSSAGERAQ